MNYAHEKLIFTDRMAAVKADIHPRLRLRNAREGPHASSPFTVKTV